MVVKRKIKVNTTLFLIGDTISFCLSSGEKVRMRAVKDNGESVIFMSDWCLRNRYPMYKEGREQDGAYDFEHSDLREYLNTNIYYALPKEIRESLVPMNGDKLRIPTEMEIIGQNIMSDKPEGVVERFHGVQKSRRRSATGDRDRAPIEYFLQNRTRTKFVGVDMCGYEMELDPLRPHGIRMVFELKYSAKYARESLNDELWKCVERTCVE